VPIHRLTCPECGAGLKSAAGFKPGSTVICPKCEAGFEAEEPEEEEDEDERPKKKPASGPQKKSAAVTRNDDEEDDDEDERPKKKKKKKKADKEWSYRNSWIRYAILAILLTVMCVLGYMLYLKNEREKRADAGSVPAVRV
jgi:uncharacterized Zn finger protein (UPF0148 family)